VPQSLICLLFVFIVIPSPIVLNRMHLLFIYYATAGLVLWQLCHLQTPYDEYDNNNFDEFVFEKGVRPKIDAESRLYPLSVLQTRCWSSDAAERPECKEIKDILRDEMEKFDSSLTEEVLDISNKTEKSMMSNH